MYPYAGILGKAFLPIMDPLCLTGKGITVIELKSISNDTIWLKIQVNEVNVLTLLTTNKISELALLKPEFRNWSSRNRFILSDDTSWREVFSVSNLSKDKINVRLDMAGKILTVQQIKNSIRALAFTDLSRPIKPLAVLQEKKLYL